ncbi:MAG: hypothetical protein WCS52_13560 [bacterium]
MKNISQSWAGVFWLLCVGLAVEGASAAHTNSVPWTESFESYSSGYFLQDTNGWSSSRWGAGLITNSGAVLFALTNTYAGIGSYPLPNASHTNVLRITDLVDNDIRHTAGDTVALDFMVMPTWSEINPLSKTNLHCALYINTNQHVVIWHQRLTPATNEWLDLVASPLINTGVWARIGVIQDYSNQMFQIKVNGSPIEDAAGYVAGGGSQPGSWFHMVQTNGILSQITFGDGGTNYLDDITLSAGISFEGVTALSCSGTNFAEAAANNGTIGNTNVISLTGDAFTAGPYVLNTHYAVANVPAGLTAQLTRNNNTQVTFALTGHASPHTSSQSTGALELSFLNPAFASVAAASITGATTNFSVTFNNAPSLAYNRSAFNELSFGTINNQSPLLITLTGDAFVSNLTGLYSVSNLPLGLTLELTRISATQVSVRLTGIASAHASGNTIHDLTLDFLQGAFVSANADQVASNPKTDLSVVFVDDLSFVNTVPYEEPFESYADGFLLAGTNAWTADYYANAGVVTNDAVVNAKLATYMAHTTPPILTNHNKTLLVQDSIQSEIHSETGVGVYVDLLMMPVPLAEPAGIRTNAQFSMYIDPNMQVVIWHRNMTGIPATNEWLTLANAPLIDTSCWTRITVAQDYTNHMFQLRINEGAAIEDPVGWTQGGITQTGSWFHMVQTNDFMSRLLLFGRGAAYLDDVTVRTQLGAWFARGAGSVYVIR